MASTLVRNLATPTPNPSPQGGGERRLRRGVCPGLSAPMPTGDGLLVRLMPTGTIPLSAFKHLCAAARRHGNGIVEVTGRGSIQVRGLNAASASRFAEAITALGIAAKDEIAVLSTALAGLDPKEVFDASPLMADLRRALTRTSLAARLAPKISVIVDGGGALNLDDVSADVRICAQATEDGTVLRIGLGGDEATATQIGAVAPAHGVDAAVKLLEVIAQHGRTARAREILAAEGDAPFRSALAPLLNESVAPARMSGRSDPIGSHRLRDELLAIGVGLAFGHANFEDTHALGRGRGRRWRRGHTCSCRPRPDGHRDQRESRARLCQCRGKSRLHRRRRRSAPVCHRLRRRADLCVGAHRLARPRTAGRSNRCAVSRRLAPDSHFRLRQRLRPHRQFSANDCRIVRRMRTNRQWFGA